MMNLLHDLRDAVRRASRVVALDNRGFPRITIGIPDLLAGFGVSWCVVRLLVTLRNGVSPVDSPIYFCAAMLFATTSLAAHHHQSRRAAQVAPTIALRYE